MRELSRREFYLLLFCPVLFVFVICYLAFGPAQTSVTLTHGGRAALESYTTILRELLDTASTRS